MLTRMLHVAVDAWGLTISSKGFPNVFVSSLKEEKEG
jgi:hypothetical protein